MPLRLRQDLLGFFSSPGYYNIAFLYLYLSTRRCRECQSEGDGQRRRRVRGISRPFPLEIASFSWTLLVAHRRDGSYRASVNIDRHFSIVPPPSRVGGIEFTIHTARAHPLPSPSPRLPPLLLSETENGRSRIFRIKSCERRQRRRLSFSFAVRRTRCRGEMRDRVNRGRPGASTGFTNLTTVLEIELFGRQREHFFSYFRHELNPHVLFRRIEDTKCLFNLRISRFRDSLCAHISPSVNKSM